MNKNLRFFGAALATAAIAIAPTWAPARADDPQSYHYVDGEDLTRPFPQVYALDLLGPRETPAGTIAPAGHNYFVAGRSALSFRVDDRLVEDGHDVPVLVGQGKKRLFDGCAPVRTIVTLSGAIPGQPVFVRVGDEFVEQFSCSAKATTGVMTISGVTRR